MDPKVVVEKLRSFFASEKGVEFAYLFGSVARGEYGKLSDIDIALMCKDRCDTLQLLAKLSKVLEFDDIDLVDLKRAKNLRLLKDIIKDGIVLKDSPLRWKWEIAKYHQALDFMSHTKAVYGY